MSERATDELPDAKRRKIDTEKDTGKGKAQEATKKRRPGSRIEAPMVRAEGEEREARLPKRMCALLLGFCGSPYRGMQYQKTQPDRPVYPTVEGTLFDALCRAGAISKDNSTNPGKVNLQRAARTDSGVHAAGNVVSLKMITSVPGQGDMLTRINEELPPEIRVWDFVRVKNSFNARTICDSRRYTYFFPSYLLLPPKPGSAIQNNMERFLGRPWDIPQDPFWAGVEETEEEEVKRKRAWRVTPTHLERLNALAARFVGSHRFHNFTVTLNIMAETNKRYMKSIEVQPPQIHGDTEWISVQFHGQSFMLHQIRKMMFVLIMACRTNTPPHIINELYVPKWVEIPKVPALGLLLEAPVYDVYNKDMETHNAKLDPDSPEYRHPIDFAKQSEKMEQFKQDLIYSSMRGVEERTGLFGSWIRFVDAYEGDDLLYFNQEGTIPSAAVIEMNVKRTKRFKEKRIFDQTAFKEHDPSVEDGQAELDNDSEDESVPLNKMAAAEMEG